MGFVTFLFTDIEGSTRLWEEKTEAMWEMLQRHDVVLRASIESSDGYIFKTIGDAFCAAFSHPGAAIQAALSAQRALLLDPLLNGETQGFALRVRMGLHCGEPRHTENDYFGPVLNRVSRVAGMAYGGQIVLSAAMVQAASSILPLDVSVKELGLCRLKGLEEPEVLSQILHPELPLTFPPPPGLAPSNLPVPPTKFIGRTQEVPEVVAMLLRNVQLVTILGPGGAGKTRLGLQVAGEVLERYSGGVWWVDLSALTDSAQVVPAIASVLGLSEIPHRSPIEQIAERMKDAPTLLVLDNFEQVVDAASDLDRLLRLCPSLQILVTSRTLLNLSREQEYPLADMAMEDAVELFLQRIQQSRPHFHLNESRPVIESIIRRLDYNPLALELAAAQARLLSLSQIDKQLNQRFRLLVSHHRDVSSRQKTLRGAIDWSYDILTEEDRDLFRQLTVFTGRFTLDDALAVCTGENVITGLMRLRDQSLLRMEEWADPPCFQMLESLREYGLEKLRELGQEAEVSGRIAHYFVQLAKESTGDSAEPAGYSNLLFHRDNLRWSLEWLIAGAEGEIAGELCLCLKSLWERQGPLKDERSYILRVLEQDITPKLEAELLRRVGWLCYRLGEFSDAESYLVRSQEIFRNLGRDYEVAIAQNERALIAQSEGRFEEARRLFLDSLGFAERTHDERRQAARLNNLGLLEIAERRFPSAVEYLRRAQDLYIRLQDHHGIAICLCNLSDLSLAMGDWIKAREYAVQSEEKSLLIADRIGALYALANLAQSAGLLGDEATVRRAVRDGIPLCIETNHRALMQTLFQSLLLCESNDANSCGVVAAIERVQELQTAALGEGTVEIVPQIEQHFRESVALLEASAFVALREARLKCCSAHWEEMGTLVLNLQRTATVENLPVPGSRE
jgi:predicted ATPase/class 3 adenylate cyclase